jgi:hypothetical protein
MTNPYEADPEKIPTTDLYADVPFYGRYCPKSDDFRVDLQHVNSQTTDSLRYWTLVVNLCTKDIRIYPADEGGRDVFALGSVIVKSSHLHARGGAPCTEIDYSYADANEARAIALAKTVLKDVIVPEIYFSGKVFIYSCYDSFIRLKDSHLLRSMVAKCLSKKDFRGWDCVSPGRTSLGTRESPTKNRPGRYSSSFTRSSPRRDFKLALT